MLEPAGANRSGSRTQRSAVCGIARSILLLLGLSCAGDQTGTVAQEHGYADPERGEGRVETPIDWASVHFIRGEHLEMLSDAGFIDNALYLLLHAPLDSPTPTKLD